jgi:hypothetical protein
VNGQSADLLKRWQNQDEIPNARTESVTKLSRVLCRQENLVDVTGIEPVTPR